MDKSLALIIESHASLTFYSDDSGAAVHEIDVSSGQPALGQLQKLTFDGQTPSSLGPGLYLARAEANHKLVCTPLDGTVSIVVLGGEDPWPIPPSKAFKSVSPRAVAAFLAR